MLCIVGLGNIGEKYNGTRHNIGFFIVDYIAKFYNFPDYKNNFQSNFTFSSINNEKIFLLKPQTYMNISGIAVLGFTSFYKCYPEDIIVIQDDIDLSFAKIRYKTNSGDAGHNGIKDIQAKLGKNIHRIKFGVGRPTVEDCQGADISGYVLSKFSSVEIQKIEEITDLFAKNIDLLIKKDFTNFIKNVNILN